MRPLLGALLLAGLAAVLAACAAQGLAPLSRAAPGAAAPQPRPDAGTLMARSANAMLGQPYRWGGAAPGGFDCSGLVAYAGDRAGIRLPRTAHEQLLAGLPVARRDLRPGDLVFMHLTRKDLHVGIAIDRDRFVHAPSAGGRVRIDSLDEPPYARGFMTARRVIGAAPPAAGFPAAGAPDLRAER